MHPLQKSERRKIFLFMVFGLPTITFLLLWLEHVTHVEFLLHLAAIPLEILLGAFLVERWIARKEKEEKKRQLMYFKSYLFRSDMRNLFIANFSALANPAISLAWIRNASLEELQRARDGITTIEYYSPAVMEEVLAEYLHARHVWRTFMEWAAANDFESIFHDMLFILHFIQDFELFKRQNPERLFMDEVQTHPRMREKAEKILKDGIVKFLDYAIELREKEPEVFEELFNDYLLSSQIQAGR